MNLCSMDGLMLKLKVWSTCFHLVWCLCQISFLSFVQCLYAVNDIVYGEFVSETIPFEDSMFNISI